MANVDFLHVNTIDSSADEKANVLIIITSAFYLVALIPSIL